MTFPYLFEDFESKNEEVWAHIETLSHEDVFNLLGQFKDKEINNGLIEMLKEKAKELPLETINELVNKLFVSEILSNKYAVLGLRILTRRKSKLTKINKEKSILPKMKTFFDSFSKEEMEAVMDILYKDSTRYRNLRSKLGM